MCQQAHRDFHAGRGRFKGWTKEWRRNWQTSMVTYYQQLYAIQKSLDNS
jgi:hypothetical protein